jgi:hypothetical protein
MRDAQFLIDIQGLVEGTCCFVQLSRGGIEHPLHAMRNRIPRCKRQRDCHRLAPEIRGRRYGPRVAPPWVADQMLAGYSQADQRLGIARVARQRRQEPTLRLGRELGAHAFMQRTLRPRQTFGNPLLDTRVGKGAPAGRLQYQDLKLS